MNNILEQFKKIAITVVITIATIMFWTFLGTLLFTGNVYIVAGGIDIIVFAMIIGLLFLEWIYIPLRDLLREFARPSMPKPIQKISQE